MALTLSIDDLDYDALVTEAQRRIIARSRGQWTLHAPVDPGITLIELFAWLLDQRSYWATQTDGDFARSVMRLLGQRPRAARAAVVPIESPMQLAAGQSLQFAKPGSDLVFSVLDAMQPLPLAEPPISVRVDGLDMAADLRAKRPFELLHAGAQPTRAEIDLHLTSQLAADHPVSLALVVDTAQAIDPQWSPDAVDAPAPAVLQLLVRVTGGTWRALTVVDGTGGLRRSGLLRFVLPADAEAVATPNVWTYTIAITADDPTFSASPIVTKLCPNATTARHATPCKISVAEPPLPLPARVVELSAPPLEDTVALTVVEIDGNSYTWAAAEDFTNAGPGDRVFVVDRAYSCLRFGDGLTGRLLYAQRTATAITGTFDGGGGESGNVGPGGWIGFSGTQPVTARSIAPSIGGRDTETLAAAALRVADALHERTRAATAEDYEKIAVATKGVAIARALAAIGFDPAEPCIPAPGVVTVFVLPAIAERVAGNLRVPYPVTDPGALAQVASQFGKTRLLGTQVHVETARYRDVEIRVEVSGDPWDPADTRARAEAAVRLHLDPLLGGPDGEGWPFGDPVRPSDIMRVVQDEIREDGDVTLVGITLAPAAEVTCGDAVLRSYELPRITALRVQILSTERDA